MKRIIGIVIGCMLCWEGEAQFRSFTGPASANQQLIEEAVREGLFIVRQAYQLEDTAAEPPAYYGRDGKSYFGQTYSVGARLDGGYVIDARLAAPWLEDAHFEEYRNSTQYRPVISKTEYRDITEIIYHPLAFRAENRDSVPKGSLCQQQDSLFSAGFSLWEEEGLCRGWVVLAVGEKPLSESDSVKVSLLIYRTEVNLEADKQLYEIKAPATSLSVMGGIYVCPVAIGIGQLSFRLAGLVQQIEDKWYIMGVKGTVTTDRTSGSLTPIGLQEETTPQEVGAIAPGGQEENLSVEQVQGNKKGKKERKKRS